MLNIIFENTETKVTGYREYLDNAMKIEEVVNAFNLLW